jgi:hypothetical protein
MSFLQEIVEAPPVSADNEGAGHNQEFLQHV